ncbi:Glutaminyl-tRNA synthetase [Coemansia sp. RSA 1646]|nr:Glutaminyl-tRNA synthetase [Coemansia sp. RSA 1646]KAJ1770036.1 Glutaminyl-tRNA synthetase [Coemansia sp. RSA 1843]
MKEGHHTLHKVTLHVKTDLKDGNPQMWDLIAYHVLCSTYHHAGNEWCICLTHGFVYCLCSFVEVYRLVQWEHGRLSVTNTILSKYKLLNLHERSFIMLLDDPCLYSFLELRRCGVPPQTINAFMREFGVITLKSTTKVVCLESHICGCLNEIAPHIMTIVNSVKVVLDSLSETHFEEIELPFKLLDSSFRTHKGSFACILYVNASDFREVDSADHYRLALNKMVGLQGIAHLIVCTKVRKNADGSIVNLICRLLNEDKQFAATAAGKEELVQQPTSHRSADSVAKQKAIIKRVSIDQIAFAPVAIAAFFTVMGAMEGKSASEIRNSLCDRYPKALVGNYMLWPWSQLINFGLVPLVYQVPFASMVSVFWNMYLSWVNHKREVRKISD